MRVDSTNGVLSTGHQGLVAVGVCVVAAAPTMVRAPGTAAADLGLVFGALAGLLLLVSAVALALLVRTRSTGYDLEAISWTTAAVVLLGSQLLLKCESMLVQGPGAAGPGAAESAVADLVVALTALALVTLGHRGTPMPRPFALTSVVALVFGVARLLLGTSEVASPVPAVLPGVLLALVVAAHLAIGLVVSHALGLAPWITSRICLSVGLVGLAAVTRNPGVDLPALGAVTNAVLAVASGFWVCSALLLLSRSLHQQQRRATALEGSLLEISTSSRGDRERMHEVRSTVAGIRAAHELAESDGLDAVRRDRLRTTVTAELARLERLVAPVPVPLPTPRGAGTDVSSTLDVLAETHRARGREVEVHGLGTPVEAAEDDLTLALNVLLENAATHAAGARSRIDVGGDSETVEILVSDDGPGVAPEVRDSLFDWGVSTDPVQGQGIGLNMARRLVSSHGGSLNLVEGSAPGATFMIRLPAARRSEENHGLAH